MMTETKSSPNLDLVLDVSVNLSVELGSCQLPMRDVLELGIGSVVPLEKASDAPVDLFVNGKLIARGEVVVIDNRFGLKIKELIGTQS